MFACHPETDFFWNSKYCDLYVYVIIIIGCVYCYYEGYYCTDILIAKLGGLLEVL
jgi:hypothetical protein